MNNYRIPEIVRKFTDYDLIRQHTELPKFPDIRIRLLYTLLKSKSDCSRSELFALVTSLVQIGLDTHDWVEGDNRDSSVGAMRTRQLRVLAGDYLSGRFYHLLAEAGQIEAIKAMSHSICEINRLKMTLYGKIKQLKLTAEEYFAHHVRLKMQLFLSFTQWMDERASVHWPGLLQGISGCELVVEELDRAESASNFRGSWGYWHILQQGTPEEKRTVAKEDLQPEELKPIVAKYGVREKLAEMLRQSVEQVQAAAVRFDSDKLLSELKHIGEALGLGLIPSAVKETQVT